MLMGVLKMSRDLLDINFKDLLPSSIAESSPVSEAASALNGVILDTSSVIKNVSILPRVYELDSLELDHLAWQFHVDAWPPGMILENKRKTIANAILLHRRKGSVWSVREALRSIGYADAEILEGEPPLTYNGSATYGSAGDYTGSARWAMFSVAVDLGEEMGVSAAEVSEMVSAVNAYKPLRCHLRGVSYRVSLADTATVSESATLQTHTTNTDVFPCGVRYDGSVLYDSGRVPVYDGHDAFDGGISFSGIVPGDLLFDASMEQQSLAIGITATDRQAATVRHDGMAFYDGLLDMGATVAPVLDAKMTITARRHWLHNGIRTYGSGKEHDGSLMYDGLIDFSPQLTYAGVHTIQEVRV